jgi:hypothetical protein
MARKKKVKVLSLYFAGRSVSLPHAESAQGLGPVRFGEDGLAEVNPTQAAKLVELFPRDVKVV